MGGYESPPLHLPSLPQWYKVNSLLPASHPHPPLPHRYKVKTLSTVSTGGGGRGRAIGNVGPEMATSETHVQKITIVPVFYMAIGRGGP